MGVIAVTGASGLIGRTLRKALLARGDRVVRVVRGAPEAGSGDVGWDPRGGRLEARALEGVEAIVHLAGEPVFGRWTAARRRRIMGSRVDGTGLVARAVSEMATPPRVVVSASAIGLYGDRPGEVLCETSAPGEGFLAEVCRAWEAAIQPASEAGPRVVRARLGIVLTAEGGALANMLPPFRLGLGGPLGDGKQMMSWISLPDVVRALLFALDSPALAGAVNVVAPAPVSGADFARTLGRVLGRPALLSVPSFALRLALGEVASVALSSADVRPEALGHAGFEFEHTSLEAALRAVLGRPA